jgi:hypothetical protein
VERSRLNLHADSVKAMSDSGALIKLGFIAHDPHDVELPGLKQAFSQLPRKSFG